MEKTWDQLTVVNLMLTPVCMHFNDAHCICLFIDFYGFQAFGNHYLAPLFYLCSSNYRSLYNPQCSTRTYLKSADRVHDEDKPYCMHFSAVHHSVVLGLFRLEWNILLSSKGIHPATHRSSCRELQPNKH